MEKIKLTPQQAALERWNSAGLENNFIFYKVMFTNPQICKRLIEILLGISIDRIEIKTEDFIAIDHDSKAVRLDVYAQGDDTSFDLEMQTTNSGDLPKRSRYYQEVMDLDFLGKGKLYSQLNRNYVIFICLDDIFGLGLPVYTFENRCMENPKLALGDHTIKVFFNSSAYDRIQDRELKSFLEFLVNKNATTGFTSRLSKLVADAKQKAEWRVQYMTMDYYLEVSRQEGLQAGKAEGRLEEKHDTALKMLEKGLEKSLICECTGLSQEELDAIKNSVPEVCGD